MPHVNTSHPFGESRSNGGTPPDLPGLRLNPAHSRGAGLIMRRGVLLAAILAVLSFGIDEVLAEQSGIAAVYSYRGGRTSSGEHSNPSGLTAAHRSLPFGTKVRVTHRRNGRSVVVRINDRGPFTRGRIIDLTRAAASQLGFSGLAPVSLSPISR